MVDSLLQEKSYQKLTFTFHFVDCYLGHPLCKEISQLQAPGSHLTKQNGCCGLGTMGEFSQTLATEKQETPQICVCVEHLKCLLCSGAAADEAGDKVNTCTSGASCQSWGTCTASRRGWWATEGFKAEEKAARVSFSEWRMLSAVWRGHFSCKMLAIRRPIRGLLYDPGKNDENVK